MKNIDLPQSEAHDYVSPRIRCNSFEPRMTVLVSSIYGTVDPIDPEEQ